MATDSSKDASFPWPIPAALVAAVVGGMLLYQAPLKSARPPGPGTEARVMVGQDEVRARLWQDPIAAAEEHARTEEESKKELLPHHTIDAIGKGHTTGGADEITVLLTMVDGSPYAEGSEARIRTREAVVSALGLACFVPEDSEHIRYFEWPSRVVVPYEWYRARKLRNCKESENVQADNRHVAVLWLKDDALSDKPLEKLSQLATLVAAQLKEQGKLEFKIIGPWGSTTLRSMMEEAAAITGEDGSGKAQFIWPGNRNVAEIYSPWATADPGLLAYSLGEEKLGLHRARTDTPPSYSAFREHVERRFSNPDSTVQFKYKINSDVELSRSLVDELTRRGVQLGKDHIALLAEWDTFYGRALPLEFTAVACGEAEKLKNDGKRFGGEIAGRLVQFVRENLDWLLGPAREPGKSCQSDSDDAGFSKAIDFLVRTPQKAHEEVLWIHRYSYLRTLDGEIPEEAASQRDSDKRKGKDKSKKKDDKDRQADLAELERPEGPSQLDYVRRLADKIGDMEAELGRNGEEFKAIGVLGSDVYDKLLILQALRKRFPRAIFFTTDLDARLLHPSQYEWTRNLIVASPFGLQLHPAIQHDIPPFRDSYQTSTFFAVLRALNHVRENKPLHDAYDVDLAPSRFSPDIPALLYEVGRTRPVVLNVSDTRGAAPPLESVHGTMVPDHGIDRRLVWAVLSVSLLGVLLLPCTLSGGAMVIGAAGGLAVVLCVFWRVSLVPGGEPFLWFEGISLWPTEVLRVSAIVAAVGLLVKGWIDIRMSNAALAAQFRLPACNDRAGVSGSSGGCWWHRLSTKCWAEGSALDPAEETWKEYLGFGEGRSRLGRMFPQYAGFAILGFLLVRMAFDAPFVPFRGELSAFVDSTVLLLSIWCFLALVVFVIDAMRLCSRFVTHWASGPTQWPSELVQAHAAQRGLDPALVVDWLDIDLTARRTETIGRLVYYPFIVMFILLVARMRLFDNWDIPPGLVLMWVISAGYVLACALMLNKAAEQARRKAVENLSRRLFVEIGAGRDSVAKQIELLIEEIRAIRNGAFLPWHQHPAFRALFFPSSGIGVVSLIEYMFLQF